MASSTTTNSSSTTATTADNLEQETETPTIRTNKSLILDENLDYAGTVQFLRDKHCAVLYVYLHSSFIRRFSPAKIAALFYYTRLPNLLGLKIGLPEEDPELRTGCVFPVKALNYFLRHCVNLEYLICNLRMVGSKQEYQDFGDMAKRLVNLDCVGLSLSLQLTSPDNNDNDRGDEKARVKDASLLDSFVKALSTISTLTEVVIKAEKPNQPGEDETSLGKLSRSSLDSICRAPRLQALYFFWFELSDEDVATMAQALEGNERLKELCISCALGRNSSVALSKMLGTNKSIKEFILFATSDESWDESIVAEMVKGLGNSSSLEEFHYQGWPGVLSESNLIAFRDMVKHNYILQTMYLSVDTGPTIQQIENEIKFYLDLNKAGRHQLFANAETVPLGNWIDILVGGIGSSDLSQLYYFLKMNPALFITEQTPLSDKFGAQQTRNNSRKRKRLYRAAKYKCISYRS